jgi:DNA modification methylase
MEVPRNLDHYKDEKIQKKNKRSHWIWRRYASPVWDDIRQMKVLEFKQGREKDDQKHICPLQRDVVERCLQLWSNPGDTVLTPFMGIGTEVYVAVKNGRRGVGIELKATYYRQALRHIQSIRE